MVKKAKPERVQSQFSGIQNYEYSLDGFGQGLGQRNGNTLSAGATLSSGLGSLNDQAQAGLSGALGQLNTPYESQLRQLQGGGNAAYNYLNELNQRQSQQALADAQLRFGRTGMENSTALGGLAGQLSTDAYLRDLATQSEALDRQNALAGLSYDANRQTIGDLFGVSQSLANQANANMLAGMQQQDNIAQFNSQQQLQADQANAQARSSLFGNILGAAGTVGGFLAGGPLGAAAGRALTGLAGRGVSGAQGISPIGSFSPIRLSSGNPFSGYTTPTSAFMGGIY